MSKTPTTPRLAVDCILLTDEGLVLIERANEPKGWALPGGMVDVGERCVDALKREMREELGVDVEVLNCLGMYDDPERDPRGHTVSVVYVAKSKGELKAGSDALNYKVVKEVANLPKDLVFDHNKVIQDFEKFMQMQHEQMAQQQAMMQMLKAAQAQQQPPQVPEEPEK